MTTPAGYIRIHFTVTGDAGFAAPYLGGTYAQRAAVIVQKLAAMGYPPINGSGSYSTQGLLGYATMSFDLYVTCNDDLGRVRENIANIIQGNGYLGNVTVATDLQNTGCGPNSTVYNAGQLATVTVHTGNTTPKANTVAATNNAQLQNQINQLQASINSLGTKPPATAANNTGAFSSFANNLGVSVGVLGLFAVAVGIVVLKSR